MSRYTEEMLFDDIDITLKSMATAEIKVACIECYMDVYKRLRLQTKGEDNAEGYQK